VSYNSIKLSGSALAENFIFAGVGEDEVNLLVNSMELMTVKAGDKIIRQGQYFLNILYHHYSRLSAGEQGDFFYVIDEGTFTVLKDNLPVISLGKGKSFGELALLSNNPRQATIRADTDGLLYTLDRQTFRYTLANSSSNRSNMISKALKQVPLLSSLTPDQISKISDCVELVKYTAGEFVF